MTFPVCAPSLIAGQATPDLPHLTLLHEDDRQCWADWIDAAGIGGVDPWRGPKFQNHLAIDAAEAGQGLALGDQVLTLEALQEKWLVKPFGFELKDTSSYYMVRAKGMKESAPARAFREWVMAEMILTQRAFIQYCSDTDHRPA